MTDARQQMFDKVEKVNEERQQARRTNKEERVEVQEEDKFANIESNPVYQIMSQDEESVPVEEKIKQLRDLRVVNLDEKLNEEEARLKMYDHYKAYLNDLRRQLAEEIILASNNGAFSELKDVFGDLQGELGNFRTYLKPLTDILDAFFDLRAAGKEVTEGIMQEIVANQKAEAARLEEIKAQETAIAAQKQKIVDQEAKVTAEQQKAEAEAQKISDGGKDIQKSQRLIAEAEGRKRFLFGLRQADKDIIISSQSDIRETQAAIETAKADMAAAYERVKAEEAKVMEEKNALAALEAKLTELRVPIAHETAFSEYKEKKQKISDMLNISSEEHKEKQQKIVDTALQFISNAEKRVSSVLTNYTGVESRVDKMFNANTKLQTEYAILGEAEKLASAKNQEARAALNAEAEGEDLIKKTDRMRNLTRVNKFITTTDNSTMDTIHTHKALLEESVQIHSMKEMCTDQIAKVTQLKAAGIGTVSMNLAATVNGIGQAALVEAAELMSSTVDSMNTQATATLEKQVLRNALDAGNLVDAFNKMADRMVGIKQTLDAATRTRESNLELVNKGLAELEKNGRTLAESLQSAIAVNAEARIEKREESVDPSATPANDDGKGKGQTAPVVKKRGLDSFLGG